MKKAIRLTADAFNWIAIIGLLTLLFPFWLLDRVKNAIEWARR